MAEHLRRFAHQEGIVFVGKAEENTRCPDRAAPQPENGTALSVDRAPQRDGEGRSRLWAVLLSRGTLFDSRVVTLFESALAAARSNSRDAICDWARALDF
jgi:hypothetical protein